MKILEKKKLILHILIFSFLWITSVKLIASGADKILVVWNKSPETNVTIRWDQVEGVDPVVYYGESDFDDEWEKYPSSQKPTRILPNSYRMNTHFAEIDNLKPDQNYYFVIKDSKGVSERYWFKNSA